MTIHDPFTTPTTTILPKSFTWKSIPGWMNYTELYDHIATSLCALSPRPTIAVEVGAWFGQSAAYLASELKRKDAHHVTFYAVDTWEGTTSEPQHQAVVARYGGSIFTAFQECMKGCGVEEWVKPMRATSVQAAGTFADGSVDFVFIDADHRFDAVVADIRAWLPKIRPGGCLAGHDFDWDGVNLAVQQELAGRFRQWGSCWVVDGV